jgi:hypothetical protein
MTQFELFSYALLKSFESTVFLLFGIFVDFLMDQFF